MGHQRPTPSPLLLCWCLPGGSPICWAASVFLQGLALFLLGSLLCGLVPNAAALIAARIVQTLGAALLTPASLALVLQAFPKDKRAIAVSLWSVVGALAAAVGPAVGSLVIELASWRWAFLINLPVGGIPWWLAR